MLSNASFPHRNRQQHRGTVDHFSCGLAFNRLQGTSVSDATEAVIQLRGCSKLSELEGLQQFLLPFGTTHVGMLETL